MGREGWSEGEGSEEGSQEVYRICKGRRDSRRVDNRVGEMGSFRKDRQRGSETDEVILGKGKREGII